MGNGMGGAYLSTLPLHRPSAPHSRLPAVSAGSSPVGLVESVYEPLSVPDVVERGILCLQPVQPLDRSLHLLPDLCLLAHAVLRCHVLTLAQDRWPRNPGSRFSRSVSHKSHLHVLPRIILDHPFVYTYEYMWIHVCLGLSIYVRARAYTCL